MSVRIVAITSEYLKEPVEKIMGTIPFDGTLEVVSYRSFADIPEIYDAYAETVDGFMITGMVAKMAIEATSHDYIRPVISLQIELATIYRYLLMMTVEKDCDMSRVIMDFLIPTGHDYTAYDFVWKYDSNSVEEHMDNWTFALDAEKIEQLENVIYQTIETAWEEKKIDMVICQYTNLIPRLEAAHIPFMYSMPGKERFRELTEELLAMIEIDRMRANLPSVIQIAPRDHEAVDTACIDRIGEKLHVFFRENIIECSVMEMKDCCGVLITAAGVDVLTHNGTSCRIESYLADELGIEVSVGYGVGLNHEEAVKKAHAARKEAGIYGKSFLINEKDELIGPLNSEHKMVLGSSMLQNIGLIAGRCSLSTTTVKKLMTCINYEKTERITTQELASRIGGTVRNANRILLNLEKGGFARLTEPQATNMKGRPSKVYEIDLRIRRSSLNEDKWFIPCN